MNARSILSGSAAVVTLLVTSLAHAQEVVTEAVTETAAHHDAAAEHGSGGLPQLDIATFPSQIFWLLVTGILLYTIMAKLALPKVQSIMRARDDFVHENLRNAAQLRRKAENAKIDYDRMLQKAENDAKDFLAKTVSDMRQKHDAAMQTAIQSIQARTADAEQRLHADRDAKMKTIDTQATELADAIMMTVFETKPKAL